MGNDLFLKEVGRNIRAMRKARKITLMQMAEHTKINRVSLSYLEKGINNSRVLTLKAIAECRQITKQKPEINRAKLVTAATCARRLVLFPLSAAGGCVYGVRPRTMRALLPLR